MFAVKDRFPPHVYYKVFTHRPIQDVGAFSPCDYTSPDFRRPPARDVHNKTERRKLAEGERTKLTTAVAGLSQSVKF